jgi:hypothetical protein
MKISFHLIPAEDASCAALRIQSNLNAGGWAEAAGGAVFYFSTPKQTQGNIHGH